MGRVGSVEVVGAGTAEAGKAARDWIGQRAVSVMSFLRWLRVSPRWSVFSEPSALMSRAWQFDDVAWLFRANQKDPDEADEAMAGNVDVLMRFGVGLRGGGLGGGTHLISSARRSVS